MHGLRGMNEMSKADRSRLRCQVALYVCIPQRQAHLAAHKLSSRLHPEVPNWQTDSIPEVCVRLPRAVQILPPELQAQLRISCSVPGFAVATTSMLPRVLARRSALRGRWRVAEVDDATEQPVAQRRALEPVCRKCTIPNCRCPASGARIVPLPIEKHI